MSLLVTLITTQSFFIQVLNSAGFLPSNFLRPRMVLARLAPSLDSVMLVTPAAVLSKGCKLLKGTLETLRAPPLVSSRSDVKVVDVKNSNRFYSCPLEVTLRSSYPLEVVLRSIPCCCCLALRQQQLLKVILEASRSPPLVPSRSGVKVVDVCRPCRPRSKYFQFLSGTVYVEGAVSCRWRTAAAQKRQFGVLTMM